MRTLSTTNVLAHRLVTLIKLSNKLATAESLDQLCEWGIKKGCRELNIDRMGLWILGDSNDHVHGTFGMDEHGHIRDERDMRLPIGGPIGLYLSAELTDRAGLTMEGEIRNHAGKMIGVGNTMVAPVQDGERIVGFLCADNYLTGQQYDQDDQIILMTYASTLGHLYMLKKEQERTSYNERRFRTFLETQHDVVYQIDLMTGRPDYVAPSCKSILGYSQSEAMTFTLETFMEKIHPDDRDKFLLRRDPDNTSRYKVDKFDYLEYRWKKKLGDYVWLGTDRNVILDDNNHPRYLVGAFRDITLQKEIEEKLRNAQANLESKVAERTAELTQANAMLQESQTRYRLLVDHAPDIITVFDPVSWQYVDHSKRALEFLAVTSEHLLSSGPGEISKFSNKHITHVKKVVRNWLAHESHEKDFYAQWDIVTGNGELIPCSVILTPLPFGDKTYVRMSLTDIREKLASERLIAEQRMKIVSSARLSSLGTMAGGIAHEINNPLAVISIAAQQLNTMLAGSSGNEYVPKLVRRILQNTKRIEDIIRGLRIVAREGSNDPYTVIPVRRALENMRELMKERFKKHGIEFVFQEPLSERSIRCRETEIGQVLLNLMSNAHDAVYGAPDARVVITSEEKDDSITISVGDNGYGIPPEHTDSIFEPFFTTKEVGKGMGLGLSISKSIIDNHGATLTFDSSDEGTTFHVTFPWSADN